jgi:hypothetical protein
VLVIVLGERISGKFGDPEQSEAPNGLVSQLVCVSLAVLNVGG